MEIKARDYKVIPNQDISIKLAELFQALTDVEGEKTLVFEKGDYYIDSALCQKEILYITNSTGEEEWNEGETKHLCNIALYLKNLKDLQVLGNGARFIIDGKVTNIVVDECENLEIEDIELKVINPDMHAFTVLKSGLFYCDFQLDNESKYKSDGKSFVFDGKEYQTSFTKSANTSWWNGYIPKNTPYKIYRSSHPFAGALKIKEIAPYVFRVYYPIKRKFKKGDIINVFDVKRKNAGIFVRKSNDVVFKNVIQHFNYGLAFVAQDNENITIDGVDFSPEKNGAKKMASVADFIQICMCKGLVKIVNSNFDSAGDDCLNVHGIHFKIDKIAGKTLNVKFCHAQSYGFNPLREGDVIEYVNPKTLDRVGSARILSSKQLDNYNITLTVDNIEGASEGLVIEDITMCPDLVFSNNTMTRIITRGLLITTRGKVLVENNRFISTSMNSILFSNDAKSWYESGRVTDAVIKRNVFEHCPCHTVCILPENGQNKNIVHGKFLIEDNIIHSENGDFYFKCAEEVTLKNNTLKPIKTINTKVINKGN